jgi:hypothetical protein
MSPPLLDDPPPDLRTADDETRRRVVHQFLAHRLPRRCWTHEAHLLVCLTVLDHSPDTGAALDRLRLLITGYNAAVGVDAGRRGYHETLTRYYVGGRRRRPASFADVVADPVWSRAPGTGPRRRFAGCRPHGLGRAGRGPLPWLASDRLAPGLLVGVGRPA